MICDTFVMRLLVKYPNNLIISILNGHRKLSGKSAE